LDVVAENPIEHFQLFGRRLELPFLFLSFECVPNGFDQLLLVERALVEIILCPLLEEVDRGLLVVSVSCVRIASFASRRSRRSVESRTKTSAFPSSVLATVTLTQRRPSAPRSSHSRCALSPARAASRSACIPSSF
jgi:hypothetical protein